MLETSKFFELGQPRKLCQPHVRDLGVAEPQLVELGQLCKVWHPRIRDSGVGKVQPLEFRQPCNLCQPHVRDLGVAEPQLFELGQPRKVWHPRIRDFVEVYQPRIRKFVAVRHTVQPHNRSEEIVSQQAPQPPWLWRLSVLAAVRPTHRVPNDIARCHRIP